MKKTLFTIDGFDGFFEGYTDGKHWNGWACPWFNKEVAEDIMRTNNAYYDPSEGWQMRYDKEQDAFIIEDHYEEPEVFKGYDIDGMHLYGIGNMSWIWDDLADYQDDQSKMLMEYLREEYHYLDNKQLYEVYYGILQEINGYMSDKEVKNFADGFMTAYDFSKAKEDEKGTGGFWDKAAEIAVQIGLEFKKQNPEKFPNDEPIYAEDFGQEIIYNALKEVQNG